MNPLLDTATLPRFDEIAPAHVAPAVDALLTEADAALERAVGPDVAAAYDALSAVLDVVTERRQAQELGKVSLDARAHQIVLSPTSPHYYPPHATPGVA